MKKILTFSLLMFFTFTISACQKTTMFPNPNADYCVVSNNTLFYKCDIAWTSYFDTRIQLTVYINQDQQAILNDLFVEVRNTLEEYHQLFDKYNSYDSVNGVYAINHQADLYDDTKNLYGHLVIEPKLFDALSYGIQQETKVMAGSVPLFNIALGPVLELWHDLREQASCSDSLMLGATVCPAPNPEIFNQSFAMNTKQIVLNPEDSSIAFRVPHMRLDLGGYGKGYVAEIITDRLDELQVPYILNAGSSNVKAGGINPNTSDGFYYIGLQRPMIGFTMQSQLYAFVKMTEGVSIVTSGNYQRYFIGFEDDKIYHHIIDPRTNFPGGDTMAVSVFYEDGALADIYSTAIYLLGLEDGLAFVNATPGLDAVWYLEDGSIIVSNGLNEEVFQYQNAPYPIYSVK